MGSESDERKEDAVLPQADAGTLADGRQSDAALQIGRGAGRVLIAHGFARLTEFTLMSGRRADLIGVGRGGEVWIVEIKSSIADFRADLKWPEYREFCDQFFFAVAPDFPKEILPADTGLILADRYGGEVIRPAPLHKLAPARRKALMLQFARTGAFRLHSLADGDMPTGGFTKE